MAYEQLSNNAQSTTTGGINNSSDPVVFNVTSASGFPSSPNFRILIDSEIMLVTAVSGAQFTATRAQEGTTIASHSSGATCTHVLTASGFKKVVSEYALSDTSGNRPAAGTVGRLFFPSDGGHMWRDNGSSWDLWVHGKGPFTPPVSTFSTWVNQGAVGAIDTTDNTVALTVTGAVSLDNVVARVDATPAPPYTMTLVCEAPYNGGNQGQYGICFRDSVSARIQCFDMTWNAAPSALNSHCFTTPTLYAGRNDFSDAVYWAHNGLVGLQCYNDGTNMKFRIWSGSTKTWWENRSLTLASLYPATINQVGYFVNIGNTRSNQTSGIRVYHAVCG